MKMFETWQLPAASPGTRRTLDIIRYGTRGARPKVYIQAGLHADEAPGYLVLYHLMSLLDEANEQGVINGEIIVLPAANPIGLSQWRDESLNGRFDFSNSINFNRNHVDLVGQVSEEISAHLSSDVETNLQTIRDAMKSILATLEPDDEASSLKCKLLSLSYDADIVLDLHCDLQASMHLYMGTALWPDGADLAAYLGAETVLLAADSGGNPFDEANSRIWWELAEQFPDHPIPPANFAVTVELRGLSDTDENIVTADARNLFSFLQHRGSIATEAPPMPQLVAEATPLTGVDYVKAKVPGIITYHRAVGDYVDAGEVIAEIINPLADNQEETVSRVTTVTHGRLFSRNVDRFARPGRIIAKVAGTKALRDDSENLLTM